MKTLQLLESAYLEVLRDVNPTFYNDYKKSCKNLQEIERICNIFGINFDKISAKRCEDWTMVLTFVCTTPNKLTPMCEKTERPKFVNVIVQELRCTGMFKRVQMVAEDCKVTLTVEEY